VNKRTTIKFPWEGDIWPIIDAWAGENGYRPKSALGAERTYQKGTGFLVAPMMLKVKQDKQETEIQAWIRANLLVRLMALFILPAEMGIESGGMRGVLPRNIARKAVNALLAKLRQPPIP
jgi:hypothetical protein